MINFKGYNNQKEFIATQGPQANTSLDFWRMILQHKVEAVVMLTSFVENNKAKCYDYFPKLNRVIHFANIKVTCKQEHHQSNFIKRVLEIEKVAKGA